MYVKVLDNSVKAFPYGPFELKADNPNTSFPEQMSDEVLARFNIYPVIPKDVPQSFNNITQNATVVKPTFVDGKWVQTWGITSATEAEIAQRLNDLASNARSTRSTLLSETDWTALKDNTMTSAMASYRQSLRDITKQSGFPTNITWPVKPE